DLIGKLDVIVVEQLGMHLAAGAAALPVLPRAARAQAYPSRPVKIVVPLPPGSAPDIKARIIAAQLTQMWDRQVKVENRHAALCGVIRIHRASGSEKQADVRRQSRPHPDRLTANEGMAFAVSAKLGVNTLGELIMLAKRDPYKFIIGTNPAGSLPHLAA